MRNKIKLVAWEPISVNKHGICREYHFEVSDNDLLTSNIVKQTFRINVFLSGLLCASWGIEENRDAKEKICFHSAVSNLNKSLVRGKIPKYLKIKLLLDNSPNSLPYVLKELQLPSDDFKVFTENFWVQANYWHLQMHPDNKSLGIEKRVLLDKEIIGISEFLPNQEQIDQFREEMQIGDIVLVRCGKAPIALVEILSDSYYEKNVNPDFDWFEYRRDVKILNQAKDLEDDFPYVRGTLKKSVNSYTPTYQYIDSWYKRTISKESVTFAGSKVLEIFIQDYKMFQDFKLSFIADDASICPVTILAGINGSGKTSLLEYINNFQQKSGSIDTDFIRIHYRGSYHKVHQNPKLNRPKTIGAKTFLRDVIYLPVDFGKTAELKKQIVAFVDEMMLEYDYRASEAYSELGNTINEIFADFNVHSHFIGLNKDKEILFKNETEKEFKIDDLSTGEKTLLTKVLFLYLKKIRNKVILIDEPELSLHPNWQNKILGLYENFARQNSNQIIIATHSPHIISSAKNEALRLLKIINGKIAVSTPSTKTYGLEFNQTLLEVMGVTDIRTPLVSEKLKELKKMIIQNNFEQARFNFLLNSLKDTLGDDNQDLRLLELEINMRKKHAKNQ